MNPWGRMLSLELAVVAVIATLARWAYPNPWVQTDEYFHLLAARSLLADGTLQVTPGAVPYERAWLFTYAVAGCYAAFGESIATGRLVSLACGVGLVAAVFACLCRHADAPAAWCGALLLCFSLPALQLSEVARFYMPHALFVWLAAWAAYELVFTTRARTALVSVVTLAVFAAVAAHTQLLTLLPAAVLGLWAAAVLAARWHRGELKVPRWVPVVAAVALLFVVAGLWLGGFFDYVWSRYQQPRPWSDRHRDDYLFYHRWMLEWRGTLYALSPLAVVVAARYRPRLTGWAAAMWVLPFLTHALINPKADRYLAYTLPFFFVIWALALGGLARGAIGRLATRSPRPAATVAVFAALAIGVFLLGPEYRRAARMILTRNADVSPYREPTFAAAARDLGTYLDGADAVVCSSGLRAIYELGRLDILLSRTALEGQPDWTPDRKLNRPAIAGPAAMTQVMRDHPRGLVVAERKDWRDPDRIPAETNALIESTARRLDLDPAWQTVAFVWGDWDDAVQDPMTPTQTH